MVSLFGSGVLSVEQEGKGSSRPWCGGRTSHWQAVRGSVCDETPTADPKGSVMLLQKGHLQGGNAHDAGKLGWDSWESILPVPLAHLQGAQVLTDAWAARIFIHEPHPHSRCAGHPVLLVPAFCGFLWLSLSTSRTVESYNKKTTEAHPCNMHMKSLRPEVIKTPAQIPITNEQ